MARHKVRYMFGFLVCWTFLFFFIIYKRFLSSPNPEIVIFKPYNFSSKVQSQYIMTFDDNQDCLPLSPKILLYNRIFKTGSTSMYYWLDSFSDAMNFSVDFSTTEDYYDTGKSHPYPEIITRHAESHLTQSSVVWFVFVAHFYFQDLLNLSSSYTYINQVRDPVKQVISNYFYIHRDKSRPLRRLEILENSGFMNESFEECLCRQHNGCQGNVMTRFFCGKHSYCKNGGDKALRKAKTNIHQYYAAVGLLEYLEVYLQILQKRFPSFVPSHAPSRVYKEKVNPLYNISEVSMATIEHIKRLNSEDLKLYEFIKERFWRQAKACQIKYATEKEISRGF